MHVLGKYIGSLNRSYNFMGHCKAIYWRFYIPVKGDLTLQKIILFSYYSMIIQTQSN